MKKTTLTALMGAAILATAASCNKSETAVATGASETIAAALANDGTYTYTLPAGSKATYRIITPSSANATVAINAAVFTYTPAADFVGTDLVEVVATSDAAASGSRCDGGSTTDTLSFQMQVTEAAVVGN